MANVTAGSAPPEGQRGQRRNMMRNPVTWVIVLGVALAGGAYLLYRRNRSSAAAQQAAAATPTDSSNQDITQGEAGTLQTEIMDLQSTAAQDEAQETGSSSTGGTGGGGGGSKAGTPARVREGTTTSSSVQILWDKAPRATAYDVRIAGKGTAASPTKNYVTTRRVAGLSTTFTGLKADTPYAIDVQALPGGGTGTIRVTTRKALKKPVGPKPKTTASHTSKAA